MSTEDTHRLIAQLKDLHYGTPSDTALRNELYDALIRATVAIESPLDTVRRLSFAPLQLSIAKIAVDLNLFEIIVNQDGPADVAELAQVTKAESLLLRRILRYMTSFDMIAESGPDSFKASTKTKSLATPGFQAAIKHQLSWPQRPAYLCDTMVNTIRFSFEAQLPAWVAMPKFLHDTNYQNPIDPRHTAFQQAHATPLAAFEFAMTRPELFADFSKWMALQRHDQPTWLDVFPIERISQAAKTIELSQPVFIDVGGGVGHQCAALVQRLPELSCRVRLQDLQPVVERAIPGTGVEAQAYDFWTPQLCLNAAFYYLRNVLHDYPDERCRVLLEQQLPALGASSVLLIDEMIVPSVGASRHGVELDIAMMASLAAIERTEGQWADLFRSVGLCVVETFCYDPQTGQSLMVVVPQTQ
ncbi:S-adenosyl-L-methionine-dependent methyltransferase [Penicillium frequentans]|uniref:S-adenosyl-L-methionine-dependent methyltransferase n=1 Tax=Penicillium frequentans TaxID=3151616 RepID=A0AAD6CVK7_9EURO|nr:S-adenosyl-L-methionine-dependent methyltransferase [Penicillium glabrum]